MTEISCTVGSSLSKCVINQTVTKATFLQCGPVRLFCYMGYSTSLALILYDVLPNNLGADTELHYQKVIAGVNALGSSFLTNLNLPSKNYILNIST